MKKIVFVTGNKNKAEALQRYLPEIKIMHKKLELDEIQSLDLEEIVEHKARQAYGVIKTPVLVEDVSLKYHALGNLPGPFIRWFEGELTNAGLCRLINHYKKDRSATGEAVYGYFDGNNYKSFSGKVKGRIASFPRGKNGFGWDPIFIPGGSTKTLAEMTMDEKDRISMRRIAADKIKNFLTQC